MSFYLNFFVNNVKYVIIILAVGDNKMNNINFTRIFLMIFIPFVFVALIIPVIKKLAIHVGALDMPNERKVHKSPMPRLGGLGIFLGFLLGYMIFGSHNEIMNSILIGSFIITFTVYGKFNLYSFCNFSIVI